MIPRLIRLRDALVERYPGTKLHPLSAGEINEYLRKHPDLPEHLLAFFRVVGCGRVGDGRYAIHGLASPDGIYDAEMAAALRGVTIFGDDFSGTCDAYDTLNGWRFGSIGCDGAFVPSEEFRSASVYLEFLLLDPA